MVVYGGGNEDLKKGRMGGPKLKGEWGIPNSTSSILRDLSFSSHSLDFFSFSTRQPLADYYMPSGFCAKRQHYIARITLGRLGGEGGRRKDTFKIFYYVHTYM